MVNKISEETRRAINRKSAYALPDAPTEMGMGADEIKKAFWKPITDEKQSAISELDRVVEEMNAEFDAREASLIGAIPHLEELNQETDENVASLEAYGAMIPKLQMAVEEIREGAKEAKAAAQQVNASVNAKLDKNSEITTYQRRVYGVEKGEQIMVVASSSPAEERISIYSAGGCQRTNEPIEDTDVATKAFVDKIMKGE